MSNQEFQPYGYGNDFYSNEEVYQAIKKRQESGITDLYGYAVIHENINGNLERTGLVISHEGNIIDDDHNEYL